MGQLAKTQGFDYSQIEDKDVRGKLTYFAGAIKKKKIAGTALILEIGADLSGAQEVMSDHSNGIFVRWLELECDYSKSQAYRFISAAKVFGSFQLSQRWKTEINDTAMYLLAANNCPQPATEEALKLLKEGKPVTHKLAKELISKYTVPAASPTQSSQPSDPTHTTDTTQEADSTQPSEPTLEVIEESEPELWEQFAAKHAEALNHLTQAIKAINWIESQGESAAYLVPIMTRIKTDYKALRGTIFSNCPVREKAGKIVTKVQERK